MTLQEILVQTEELTPDEKVQLATHLMAQAELEISAAEDDVKWMDIAGTLPYPATGMDAQAWVNQSRGEWEEREKQLRSRE